MNVALPSIARDLRLSISGLQWVMDGYLLTLSALILLGHGGADRRGRKREQPDRKHAPAAVRIARRTARA